VKECRINHAEDGSVRADAERERDNRNRGKGGMLSQHSQSKAQIRKP
jgi:hypothetical protein